jgi:hypothetical protein
VRRQAALGSISREARVLEGSPIAEPTEDVIVAFRVLHPAEAPPTPLEPTEDQATATDEILSEVLNSLPRGSAGGPCGWTFEHVIIMMGAPRSNQPYWSSPMHC